MYNIKVKRTGKFNINNSYQGDPLEVKLRKILEEKTPIEEEVPMIYTEKKDGVLPGYDIRTDRFEIAMDAMEKMYGSEVAETEDLMGSISDTEKVIEPKIKDEAMAES